MKIFTPFLLITALVSCQPDEVPDTAGEQGVILPCSDSIPPCTYCMDCPDWIPYFSVAKQIKNFPATIDTVDQRYIPTDAKLHTPNPHPKRQYRFFFALDLDKLKADYGDGLYIGRDGQRYGRLGYYFYKDHKKIICYPFRSYATQLDLKDTDVGKNIFLNGYLYVYISPESYPDPYKNSPGPCDEVNNFLLPPTIAYFVPCSTSNK